MALFGQDCSGTARPMREVTHSGPVSRGHKSNTVLTDWLCLRTQPQAQTVRVTLCGKRADDMNPVSSETGGPKAGTIFNPPLWGAALHRY